MLSWFKRRFSSNAAINIGRCNTILQIIGGDGTGRPLPLLPVKFVESPQAGGGIAVYLEWRTRLADFTGRETEMKALRDWLAESHPLSFKIVHADGGIGKTRLAAELADSEAVKAQWKSGWVDLDTLHATDRLHWEGQWLLLVDYPEHNPQSIAALAKAACAQLDNVKGKVRVLLLCREPQAVDALLQQAHARAHQAPSLTLAPLAADRHFAAFTTALGKRWQGPAPDPVPLRTAFDRWLGASPLHATSLFVNALALDVAEAKRPVTGQGWLAGVDLLKALLARESIRWKLAEDGAGAPPGSARDVLFWASLLGGVTAEHINTVLAPLYHWTRPQTQAVHAALNVLRAQSDGSCPPVEPDLLGAVFLTQWLQTPSNQAPEAPLAEALGQLWHNQNPVMALARANLLGYDQTVRLQLVRPSVVGAVDSWLTGLLGRSSGLAALAQRALASSDRWGGLPGFAGQVASETVKKYGSIQSAALDEPALSARARDLGNASLGLSGAGDRAGALAVAREAVDIYRRLA